MKKLNLDSHVRIYDNGGKTLDRFTAVYMDCPERQPNMFDARAMSESPFSPQGFGCSCSAMPGRHLGKRIRLSELPKDCQRLVLRDLKEIFLHIEGRVPYCEPICDLSHQVNELLKQAQGAV